MVFNNTVWVWQVREDVLERLHLLALDERLRVAVAVEK